MMSLITASTPKPQKNLVRKFFDTIHTTKANFGLDKDYQINCEQIPGESAC